ncbi:MAG: hypothetical protein IJ120_01980 [Solobacterium sp.]|nr:hypothetical protein [Solobacterium sp.]
MDSGVFSEDAFVVAADDVPHPVRIAVVRRTAETLFNQLLFIFSSHRFTSIGPSGQMVYPVFSRCVHRRSYRAIQEYTSPGKKKMTTYVYQKHFCFIIGVR